MKIMVQRKIWSNSLEFLVGVASNGVTHVAAPLEFSKVEPGAFTQPTFQLTNEEAQDLIDDLWRCGLRPTEGTGSAGSLKATQNHLEDMRTLTFKLIDGR